VTVTAELDGLFVDVVTDRSGLPIVVRWTLNEYETFIDEGLARRVEAKRLAELTEEIEG
jgi:hypothetical protein